MAATYGFLFLAFAALYLPPLHLWDGVLLRPWQVCFIAALASGLVLGLIEWPALLALVSIWVAADFGNRGGAAATRTALRATAITLAVALALHVVPGFPDPVIAKDVQLTPSSAAMSLRANFDKGAAGLLLLAYFSERPTVKEWPRVLAVGVGFGLATAAVAIGLVAGFGAILFDPKWTEMALLWMPINLLLTCVFEEMLFRRFLLRWLRDGLAARPRLRLLPLALSSLLFGMAHAGGGPLLIAAATVAGVGYGLAYERTQRIEAAVLAHFVLNATHFFLFTYPYASR